MHDMDTPNVENYCTLNPAVEKTTKNVKGEVQPCGISSSNKAENAKQALECCEGAETQTLTFFKRIPLSCRRARRRWGCGVLGSRQRHELKGGVCNLTRSIYRDEL